MYFCIGNCQKIKILSFFPNPKILSLPHTHFVFYVSIWAQIFSTCIDE